MQETNKIKTTVNAQKTIVSDFRWGGTVRIKFQTYLKFFVFQQERRL